MASQIVETLVTRVELNDNYTRKATRITAASRVMGASIDSVGAASTSAAVGLRGLTFILGGVIIALGAVVVVATAAGAAIGGLFTQAVKMNAEIEALTLGLQTFTTSSEELNDQLERARTIARLPGLGYQEALEGLAKLQGAGLNFRLAERSLTAFGNAVATVGGGKEELNAVALALSQIVSKGKLMGQEVRQLQERIPQIRQVMLDAFGTADSEELAKQGIGAEEFILGIVAGLEKLPSVVSKAKNAFENLSDSWTLAMDALGSTFNDALVPVIEVVGGFFDFLASSDILKNLGEQFGNLLGDEEGREGVVRFLAIIVATLEMLPTIIQTVGNIAIEMFNTISASLNEFIEFINEITSSKIGKALGLPVFGLLGMIGASMGAKFNDIADEIGTRADEIVGQFREFEQTSNVGTGPGGFRFTIQEAQLAALREIALSTREALEIQKTILGGGTIGGGISAVELAGLKRGTPGGGDPMSEMLEAMRAFMGLLIVEQNTSGRRDPRRLGLSSR